MSEDPLSVEITMRPAASSDAEHITCIYLESAEYHAGLDAERFYIPERAAIVARYSEAPQHPPHADGSSLTLVAELGGEIVGFVDLGLMRSPDSMHREMLYCHIVELAVSRKHQSNGIGAQLLRAAEDWGRQQGAGLALLEYLTVNRRASLLYERLGYRPVSIAAIKRL